MRNAKYYLLIILILAVIVTSILIFNNKERSEIEQFDINTESVEQIDEYLVQLEKTLENKEMSYTSEKTKNTNVYSLLVTIKDESYENDSKKYQSYNVDIKTEQVLNNEEVAALFGYSLNDIEQKVTERLQKYYNEEINEGYVDSNECKFSCYLSFYRNIESIEDMYSLYVENDKLYVYLSFSIDATSSDVEYFENLGYDPFKIEL